MSEFAPAVAQIAVLLTLLALSVPLLGRHLAHLYTCDEHLRVEQVTYRVLRVDPDADQHWRSYAIAVLGFSMVGILALYAFGRCSSTCRSRSASTPCPQTVRGTPPSPS